MLRNAGGFTYLGVLLAVAFLGIALAAVGTLWSTTAQRNRETELLFVGGAYRDAIGSYYRHGPGVRRYPQEIDELIEDRRFPVIQRHLRRLYPDPMTAKADWELIRDPASNGIIGVRSRSLGSPLKRANFSAADAAFEGSDCYCDWRFEFKPMQGRERAQPARARADEAQ